MKRADAALLHGKLLRGERLLHTRAAVVHQQEMAVVQSDDVEFPFPKWEELAGTAYWYSPIVYAANAGRVDALKKMYTRGFDIVRVGL